MKRLFLIALCLIGTLSSAERIQRFVVDITIEQSGALFVTETIDYDFEGASRHGIYRDIPFMIKYAAVKRDLGVDDFFVLMDNAPVRWVKSSMHSTHAGEIIRIKIGSADRLISGKHTYTISYRIVKGVLPAADDKTQDAVRWNVIGTGWRVPITAVEAHFILPASLSQGDIRLSTYTGSYGEVGSTAHSSWKDPRHLRVAVNNLKPHEGLTVELAFPAHTLDQNGLENTRKTFWEQILGSWHWAALFGFLLFFYKKLKEQTGYTDRRAIAVQYQPPKDLSLLQAGLMLDKKADEKDFAAAVLELAQLGYIEIHNKQKHGDPILKRTVKKIKNLTTDQVYLLNHTLFSGRSTSYTLSGGSESKATALRSDFSKTNRDLYRWSVADGYLSEDPQKTRSRFFKTSLSILLPLLLLTLYTLSLDLGGYTIGLLLFSSVFVGAGMFVFFQQGLFSKVFGLVFAAMGGGIPLLSALNESGIEATGLLFGPLGAWLILLFASVYVHRHVGKFTPKGAQTHKYLLGLELFVKRVKTDEIKRRLARDPLYLDRLLPYAMLFGETKHWISFYGALKVSAPGWYVGDLDGLSHFDSSISSAAIPPSSSSSSGGGGFSGDGGFSGGGGGGGGGGSW